MLAVLVDFTIRADKAEAFAEAIAANARQSLAEEPGCHHFDVCRDPRDASVFFLYELYTHDRSFAAHLQMPHFLQMNAATADWVVSKAVRQLKLVGP